MTLPMPTESTVLTDYDRANVTTYISLLDAVAAGEVVALGDGAMRYKTGDTITALLNGGGYAEYALVEIGTALPIPCGLSITEAAALPETNFTVWHTVFERVGLKAGKRLLVHGGSSGIGPVAIQLAKALGVEVIATAGSPEKCAACRKLCAGHAIDYRVEDFVAAVGKATGGAGWRRQEAPDRETQSNLSRDNK